MKEIQQKLIGTWKLVYSVEFDDKGNKYYPFGEDAHGYIIYDAKGTMAVQIFRHKRQLFTSGKMSAASQDELASIPKDYLAYCGSYEIDVANQMLKHHIQGHLSPNEVGKIFLRKYHFFDDKLSLKPHDGTNREILWQRVS